MSENASSPGPERYIPPFAGEIARNINLITTRARQNNDGYYIYDVRTTLFVRGGNTSRIEFFGDIDGVRVERTVEDVTVEKVEEWRGRNLLDDSEIQILKVIGHKRETAVSGGLAKKEDFTAFVITDSSFLDIHDCFALGDKAASSGVLVPEVLGPVHKILQDFTEGLAEPE